MTGRISEAGTIFWNTYSGITDSVRGLVPQAWTNRLDKDTTKAGSFLCGINPALSKTYENKPKTSFVYS